MAGATLSGCYSKKSLVWSEPYRGRDIFFGLIISFKLILETFRKSAFFRNLIKIKPLKKDFAEIIALKVHLYNIYVLSLYLEHPVTGRIR